MNHWNARFIELAQLIASWSKDPSTKVGAVVISPDRKILGTGYNGFPRGIADTEERLNHRPTKYKLVVHAERNAVLNSGTNDLFGSALYCTHIPCMECAKEIIQAGIKVVYTPAQGHVPRWSEEQEEAIAFMAEAGVKHVVVTNG